MFSKEEIIAECSQVLMTQEALRQEGLSIVDDLGATLSDADLLAEIERQQAIYAKYKETDNQFAHRVYRNEL